MSMIKSLLLLAAVAYLTRYIFRRWFADVRLLPSAPPELASWVWGHELLVFQGMSTEMYTKWAAICGPIFRIKGALLHSDIIVAADHTAVQHIFQYCDLYVKSPQFRPPAANLFGKGLVWAEGDEHKLMRRILSPAFTPEAVKGMADDIFQCAEKLESKLTSRVLYNNGDLTINICEYTSTCTLDIIGRVAFGHDFQGGESVEAKEIAANWVDHVNSGLGMGMFVTFMIIRAFPSITQLSAIAAAGRIKQIITKLAYRIVEREQINERSKDILSILMTADQKRSHSEEGLTLDQIIANITTFTMVGHETTAGSINFTLLELARHRKVQQKLRQEVRKLGHDMNYDDIQKLEYLDAVVKEGLRLHPASPQTERIALKDDILPLSKPVRTADGRVLTSLHIKAGQVFHIPFSTMHVNTETWGPDAADFVPERWITPGGIPPPSELPHGWSGLVAFCDGPRNCIGYRLAVFEFKVIVATLIRSLEFHETDAHVVPKVSPTLQPVTDGRGALLPLAITLAPSA